MPRKKSKTKRVYGPRTSRFVRNCVTSPDTGDDWELCDAVACAFLDLSAAPAPQIDLREDWWPVSDQGKSGACVGFATADGVLRWLFTKHQMINPGDTMSARFIWMANKETDDLTRFPTSFLERAGTTTKLALKVARKYGCVTEKTLSFKGDRCQRAPAAFYAEAAQFRIESFFNLWKSCASCDKITVLKHWLAKQGPILARTVIDKNFEKAKADKYHLTRFDPPEIEQGHAICLVGYSEAEGTFIIRNSWGAKWGKDGFAYASYDYVLEAVTEVYGAVLNRVSILELPPHG